MRLGQRVNARKARRMADRAAVDEIVMRQYAALGRAVEWYFAGSWSPQYNRRRSPLKQQRVRVNTV